MLSIDFHPDEGDTFDVAVADLSSDHWPLVTLKIRSGMGVVTLYFRTVDEVLLFGASICGAALKAESEGWA